MAGAVYSGKNIYITGGSSGIGLASAKLFSSLGANVIIFARRKDLLEEALETIRSCRVSSSQRFSFVSVDVKDHSLVARFLTGAAKDFGKPDILINSAGIAYPNYFEKITPDMFELTIKTNILGVWNVLSNLAPLMKESGGHIVNVSSVAGFLGIFGYTAYSASKFAVIGMSESLRSEMKPFGVRVSVLCPPDTDTPGLSYENITKPSETKAISGSAGIMSPDTVARYMVRGMEKGQFLIIPGFEGKAVHFIKGILPRLVDVFMDFKVRQVQRNRRKI